MFKKAIPQHKRVSMGGGHVELGYKRGGAVTAPNSNVTPKLSPLVKARRDNGVVGMKKGGKC